MLCEHQIQGFQSDFFHVKFSSVFTPSVWRLGICRLCAAAFSPVAENSFLSPHGWREFCFLTVWHEILHFNRLEVQESQEHGHSWINPSVCSTSFQRAAPPVCGRHQWKVRTFCLWTETNKCRTVQRDFKCKYNLCCFSTEILSLFGCVWLCSFFNFLLLQKVTDCSRDSAGNWYPKIRI